MYIVNPLALTCFSLQPTQPTMQVYEFDDPDKKIAKMKANKTSMKVDGLFQMIAVTCRK